MNATLDFNYPVHLRKLDLAQTARACSAMRASRWSHSDPASESWCMKVMGCKPLDSSRGSRPERSKKLLCELCLRRMPPNILICDVIGADALRRRVLGLLHLTNLAVRDWQWMRPATMSNASRAASRGITSQVTAIRMRTPAAEYCRIARNHRLRSALGSRLTFE